ncbi:unnamed protein product [Symbiodinium sp. CCMP2592]|nr:unnamed protein product [Symbiodinium sp. CCMP2592]CAE7335366.1 unnamed protein product [Symbiodinium sp. CCMP2592]
MPKRSHLEAALGRQSETSLWRARALDQAADDSPSRPKQRSGAWKRKTAQILAPFRRAYTTIQLPAATAGEDDVVCVFADVKEMLRLCVAKCPCIGQVIARAELRDEALQVYFCQDECTAGNVLATEARQKLTLLYLTFKQYGDAVQSQIAWFPISCASRDQIHNILGGTARLTVGWLREWHRQSLSTSWQCGPHHCRLELTGWVSDFDALRLSFDAKGSAGLRPCFLCQNVVSKRTEAPAEDDRFVPVSESNPRNFVLNRQDDVVQFMQDSLHLVPRLSKADVAMRETCSGFRLRSCSIWSCPLSRRLLRLDMIMNDSMHAYFADGIASQELILIWNKVNEVTGMSLKDLEKAVLEAGWSRPAVRRKHGETRSWVQRLFREKFFAGEVYKGSASETQALVVLFRWYAIQLQWHRTEGLRTVTASFLQLCRCRDALLRVNQTKHWSKLDDVQQSHMRAFMLAHAGHEKPKHHHRMHLPKHYEASGMVLSCYATEAKHKLYKGQLASCVQQFLTSSNGGSEHGLRSMPRLLLKHCTQAADEPLLLYGKWEILDQLKENELPPVRLPVGGICYRRLRIGLLDISRDDILLAGREYQQSGLCDSFYRDPRGDLHVCFQPLLLSWKDEAHLIFNKDGPKRFVLWSDLYQPATPTWHCRENDSFLCIP